MIKKTGIGKYKKCPKCNFIFTDEDKKCKYCGTPLGKSVEYVNGTIKSE